ncbi:MAG: FtsX-like permease family protein [bacterium]
MLNWFTIGARNLLRNKRRSAFTIGAVALGFAAVNLFGGFTRYVYNGLEDSYVYAYGNGHLTLFREGYLQYGALHPERYLLTSNDLATVTAFLSSEPDVLYATPQLNVVGLLSNGRASTIAAAEGRNAADTRLFRAQGRGTIGRLSFFHGAELDDARPAGVGVSQGLASLLGLTNGSEAILMATTVDGQMNALDVRVVQTVDSPVEALDNMLMSVPLGLSRKLYDTAGADRLVVLLRDPHRTAALCKTWQEELRRRGVAVEIRTWEELRISYLKICNMFNVLFTFLFSIVLVIVVLSVVNTVGMAVMERTREIGTLRALGLRRSGIVMMFAVESLLLGVIGSAIGMVMTTATILGVRLAGPTWIPPNIPVRVPLEVHFVPGYITLSLASLCLLCIVAAVLPARRASRMSIIDALGHV